MAVRNQHRIDACFNFIVFLTGNADQLDHAAEFPRVADIGLRQFGDSLMIDIVESHTGMESDGSHDGDLSGCIQSFDIGCRIRFRIAQTHRDFQCFFVAHSLLTHFRQDEIGCSVDNAHDF